LDLAACCGLSSQRRTTTGAVHVLRRAVITGYGASSGALASRSPAEAGSGIAVTTTLSMTQNSSNVC